MIPKYDRLNGIETEEELFDFVCPICGADGIKDSTLLDLKLIGVSTKPADVDNSDLPEDIRPQYDRLPTMRQALLRHTQDTDKEKVIIFCRDCGPLSTHGIKMNKPKLRKWLDKHYPEVLRL